MEHKQLFDNEKLEYISYFSEKFAHDFKNKINVILGYSSLLLEKEDDHRKKILLNNIVNSCKTFNATIKNMLIFSRNISFRSENVAVNSFLEKKYKEIIQLSPSGIKVKLDTDPEVRSISIDREAFFLLLKNLCLNAIESIEDTGTVHITSRYIHQEDETLQKFHVSDIDHIMISVSDNGQGIDEFLQDSVFDPFFTTKIDRHSSSVGLGLSVVYGIVKYFDGCLRVLSEKTTGTEIQIIFPVSVENNRSKHTEKTVLIVDDDELVLNMIETLVISSGYKTLTALSPEQAIEIFKQQHEYIDCVLMDWGMPGMNGIETFLKMKEISPDIHGILSTGYEFKDMKKFDEAGFKALLKKPYDLEQIEEAFQKVFDQ